MFFWSNRFDKGEFRKFFLIVLTIVKWSFQITFDGFLKDLKNYCYFFLLKSGSGRQAIKPYIFIFWSCFIHFAVFLCNDSVLLRALAGVCDRHAEDGARRRHRSTICHHGHTAHLRHPRPWLLGHQGNVLHPHLVLTHGRMVGSLCHIQSYVLNFFLSILEFHVNLKPSSDHRNIHMYHYKRKAFIFKNSHMTLP